MARLSGNYLSNRIPARGVNLCEMKFTEDPFAPTREFIHEIERKKTAFRRETGTRHQIFTTLITPYGMEEINAYAAGIDNLVTADAFFIDPGSGGGIACHLAGILDTAG